MATEAVAALESRLSAEARRGKLHELAKAACVGEREARRELEAAEHSPELLCALSQVFAPPLR